MVNDWVRTDLKISGSLWSLSAQASFYLQVFCCLLDYVDHITAEDDLLLGETVLEELLQCYGWFVTEFVNLIIQNLKSYQDMKYFLHEIVVIHVLRVWVNFILK